jgi:hypothetical protein
MAGAEAFRAIRSYLSTTAKHGTLDALTRAASGTPRSLKHQHDKAEEHLSSKSSSRRTDLKCRDYLVLLAGLARYDGERVKSD